MDGSISDSLTTARAGFVLAIALVCVLPGPGRAQEATGGFAVPVVVGTYALFGAGIDALIHGRTTVYRANGP